MIDQAIRTFVLLSAITMALAYRPILNKLSMALASPYPKADMTRRFFAAGIDIITVSIMWVGYRTSGSLLYMVAGLAYLLLRDAVAGRSFGKFVCGLVVVDLATGRPCSFRAAVRRNVLLVLPGANVVAAFLEATTIVQDPCGQRLGDRFAMTEVVEGFGASDVVAAVQEWWLRFTPDLEPDSRKPAIEGSERALPRLSVKM
jgi:uncharacterized RDD family membrane protein YckC